MILAWGSGPGNSIHEVRVAVRVQEWEDFCSKRQPGKRPTRLMGECRRMIGHHESLKVDQRGIYHSILLQYLDDCRLHLGGSLITLRFKFNVHLHSSRLRGLHSTLCLL
jgi:hypothetical protein